MSDPFVGIRRGSASQPRRFQVLGERSSGTNLVHVLCKRNLDLSETDELGWKHGFPAMLAVPRDVLVIVAVRNALDWARSMHTKPWHASPEIQKMAFSDFLRAPWESFVDRYDYFGMEKTDPRIGEPLLADRHPISGLAFPNIIAMRNAKISALLGLTNRGCNLAVVRMEEVQADPKGFISRMSDVWSLPQQPEFRGVHRRLGSRFKAKSQDRPETPPVISEKDREFILSQLDSQQESLLGYTY